MEENTSRKPESVGGGRQSLRFDRHTKARVNSGTSFPERTTSSNRLNGYGLQTGFAVVVELPV